MKRTSQFWRRGLAFAAVPAVCLALWAAETQTPPGVQPAAESARGTNSGPLSPGQSDGRIAYVAAEMLAANHYSRQRLDDGVSEKFYLRYLESLDPQRLHFTQADLAEFDHYRNRLDDLTVTSKRTGDVSPAFEIFNRFRLRLEQRVAFADKELKEGTFDFTTDERMQISRKDAPYPKDLAEARELWRQRLRYEYLQEKLAKLGAKKKPTVTVQETPAPDAAPAVVVETNPAPVAVKKKTDAEDIVDTLARRYARNLRFFTEWDHEDVMQVYLTALAHVYDPHSDYMNKIQADNFAIGMNNTLFGIGAELRSEDGYCTINRLVAGGPAEKSKKLKEKDRIVGVAQGEGPVVDVVEMSLNKVVQMIRGTKGTEVRLTVQPANQDASERYVLSLIRDEIKLEDQAAKAKVIEIPNGKDEPLRLGVIDLPSFYFPIDRGRERQPLLARGSNPAYGRYTSVDVAALLKKFKTEKVSGVILDLRRNGGGSLEEAIKLTGLFIKDGPVVQVRNSEGDVFVDEDVDESVAYDGPLVVLTSRFSASASEILAGALQDYGRAVIVGDQSTHGKGTVQNLNELRPWVGSTYDPGQLKVTIRKFYRASGASTQKKGVFPDIVLPSILNHSEDIGESALDTALEWDEIKSAKYDKLDLVEPYLGELLRRSATRTATNQDFVYVREDIEHFRKTQADKTVSLNEAERLKEKEESETRQKARDKERLSRKEADKKIYELALKHVELPGLPPPVEKTNAVTAQTSRATGFSTNSASVPSRPVRATGLGEEDAEEASPAVDATLEEAERILTDYISLLGKKNLAATRTVISRPD
jgi:carboxyl-terminal processing protease